MQNIEYPILSIDYGDKHFGIAISDFKGILATPLTVLSITKNRDIHNIIEDINQICIENKVKTLLIGYPQPFTEQQQKTTKKIDKFIEQIKSNIQLPIILQDESFSTIQAQNMLTFSGQTIKNTRNKIDKISATVFLQEFLNSNHQNK